MTNVEILKNFEISFNSKDVLTMLQKKYLLVKENFNNNENINFEINYVKKIDDMNLSLYDKSLGKISNSIVIISTKKKLLRIKNSIFEKKIVIEIENKFPKIEILNILDDLIFLKFIQLKLLPIHSSGIYTDNRGYLVASFGGVGKTRLILEAIKNDKSCLIADEWCLIKEKKLFPLSKEILLMDYDILSNPEIVNKFDYLRTKILKILPLKILKYILTLLRLGLPYKYKSFDNVKTFRVHEVYFLNKTHNSSISKENTLPNNLSNQIIENFCHEKKKLIHLVELNNSINFFKSNTNIIDLYRNLLQNFLIGTKCYNLNIPLNNKNFSSILNIIINND